MKAMVSLAAAAATRGTRGSWMFCLGGSTKLHGHARCRFPLSYHNDAARSAAQTSQRRRFDASAQLLLSPVSSLIPHPNRGHAVSSSSSFYFCFATTAAKEFSTDSITNNKHQNDPPSNGEEAFQRYMDLCESLQEIRREKERIKSEEMYQAWQKASSASNDGGGSSPAQQPSDNENKTNKQNKKKKNVAAGVAVVQTLAKQTRQETQQQQRQDQGEAELQAQATKVLQMAALDFDHPDALVIMGNDLVERVQQEEKYQEASPRRLLLKQALDLYQRAGELGLDEGWYNQGQLLWTGYPDQTTTNHELLHDENKSFPILLPADRDAAMKCFWKAIDLGDADAMYFVGAQLLSSDDDHGDASTLDEQTVADLKKGLELIQQAGTMGHSGALYYLALLHLSGHQALSIPACSPDQFVERLDAAVAAAGSNADAIFTRGHCYYHGENGYAQDYRKAVEDFLKAADGGNAEAAVSAAAMIITGRKGVPRDQQKAFELYQHAGELGNVEGWRNVVACYARGEGVPKSLEMAEYIAKTMLRDN
jgi:TPR repeat protein